MNDRKVPVVAPMSREAIERWADRFLSEHYPDVLKEPGALPVPHLVDVLLPGAFGINNGIAALPPGIDGVTEPPNTLTLREDVYDGMVRGVPRDRFTAAHESCHALLHLRQLNIRFESLSHPSVRVYRRSEVPVYRDPEWQANAGAAALLMPARIAWRLLDRYGPRPSVLVEVFGVSKESASYRVNDAMQGRLWRPS
jgi:hypothetical protein